MDNDVEILKLELKALRIKNAALEAELKVLHRFRRLVARSSELVLAVPKALTINLTPRE